MANRSIRPAARRGLVIGALLGIPAGLAFFTFGYVAGAQAAFEGMQRLEPGTALIVDVRAGTTRAERFSPRGFSRSDSRPHETWSRESER